MTTITPGQASVVPPLWFALIGLSHRPRASVERCTRGRGGDVRVWAHREGLEVHVLINAGMRQRRRLLDMCCQTRLVMFLDRTKINRQIGCYVCISVLHDFIGVVDMY